MAHKSEQPETDQDMFLARDKLIDSQCKAAKSGEFYDGAGLILQVHGPYSKNWVYRYQLNGRRTTFGLGSYPGVCLAEARRLHKEAEASAKVSRVPITHRVEQARAYATLNDVIEEYFQTKEDILKTGRSWLSPFQQVTPNLGDKQVDQISVTDLAENFKPIWKLKPPTARRALNRLGQMLS